jgi:hypothetical protein
MGKGAVKPRPITEREFSQQVTDLADTFGWATYHPYLSIRSTPGWPDLTLVRPPRFVVAELKTEKGKLSIDQDYWIGLLRDCPGIEVFIWRPSDWDEIVRLLK